MKILFATDGSEHSQAAIEEIARLSFPTKSEVRIISVYNSASIATSIPSSGGNFVNFYEDIAGVKKKAAEDIVKKAAESLRKLNKEIKIKTVISDGFPKEEILNEAEKMKANMIIVGSHGQSAIERFLLGSISQSVATHAKCSVLICRGSKKKSK